mgnify:CR=1 FL=1
MSHDPRELVLLSNRVFDSYDAIVDACCDAWNWLADKPERITSIASRAYAQVGF